MKKKKDVTGEKLQTQKKLGFRHLCRSLLSGYYEKSEQKMQR